MSKGADELVRDADKPGKSEVRANKKTGKESEPKSGAELGMALRTIYDEAVREDVPRELLDLLGKLR